MIEVAQIMQVSSQRVEMDKLIAIVEKSGLQKSEANPLLSQFGETFVEAHKLIAVAEGIKVTDASQVEQMAKARETRLKLQKLRTDADKRREALKEGYLRGGNAVQEIFNNIKKIIAPIELQLKNQEDFIQIQDHRRRSEAAMKRNAELLKYGVDGSHYDTYRISEEAYQHLLSSSKLSFEAKIAEQKKLEADRIAREEAGAKKQEEIRRENIKLRAEAEEKDKKIAEERRGREASEAKLYKQKELQRQKEHQIKQAAIEQQKRIDEEKRQIELAPDREKLFAFANMLVLVDTPTGLDSRSQKIIDSAMLDIEAVANSVRNQARGL